MYFFFYKQKTANNIPLVLVGPEMFKRAISRLHVFPYSERPGTRALSIEHTVSQEDKHRRTSVMLGISERKLEGFASQFIGTVRPVLIEHQRPGHPTAGFTDNYLRVEIDGAEDIDNVIAPVHIDSVMPGGEALKGHLAR